MAKTLFGALIVDMRNKLGGHVLSKNKGGSFIRRKVSPIQPRTGPQLLIRGILSSISRAWGGTLDDTKRQAWTDFAAAHPVTDVFGQSVKLTGAQMFQKLNAVIIFLGGVLIDTPPASLDVGAITDFDPMPAETGPAFTLDSVLPATIDADEKYVVWATPQNVPGRNALDSQYAFVQAFDTLTAGDLDIETAYIAKYGALEAGKKIGVGIRVQNMVTGASSPLVNKVVTVGA
jgi:hypothetical protein